MSCFPWKNILKHKSLRTTVLHHSKGQSGPILCLQSSQPLTSAGEHYEQCKSTSARRRRRVWYHGVFSKVLMMSMLSECQNLPYFASWPVMHAKGSCVCHAHGMHTGRTEKWQLQKVEEAYFILFYFIYISSSSILILFCVITLLLSLPQVSPLPFSSLPTWGEDGKRMSKQLSWF